MDINFVIAMFIGPITAIITLSILVRSIETYFDERSMYFSLLIGIFSGMFFALAHYVSGVSILRSPGGFLILAPILTLIITIGMAIVIGLRRFRESREGALYGIGLGSGIGSMIPVIISYAYLRFVFSPSVVVVLWLYGLSSILTHASVGFRLGLSIREKRYWHGIGGGALYLLPYNILLLWWYVFIFDTPHSISWEIIAFALTYSAILAYVTLRDVQRGLNPEMRRRWQRDRRKGAR